MPIQAQIRPSSMSSTGLSEAELSPRGRWDELRDAVDVFIEAGFDGLNCLAAVQSARRVSVARLSIGLSGSLCRARGSRA